MIQLITDISLNPDYNVAAALLWSAVGLCVGGIGANEYCKRWRRGHK